MMEAPIINFSLHPRQMEALQTPATDLFFGGATRGGKSYFTRVALILWCTWVPGLQCFIFRKYYDDVLQNHMEGPDGFRALLGQSIKMGAIRLTENQVRWPRTGSLITLGHCASDEAVEKAQGVPKHVLVLEEACQMQERHIRFLRTWVSMPVEMQNALPEPLKGKFPRIISTGNPIGVSMGYYRRKFVKAAPKGTIFRAPLEEGGFLRQYIEARLDDNPSEDPSLVRARVAGLGDAAMTDALLNANWDAPVGDFFPQYDEKRHSTPDFRPPEHWFKFMTFDWGSAEPFAVLWWCISDGEEFLDDKRRARWFRKGALIAYREWYGCDRKDPAKGCEMRNQAIAQGIRDRTAEHTSGIILTDSKPFQDVGMGEKSKKYKIADVFAEHGVPLLKANTARITGWAQVRDRLIGIDGDAMLLLTESCIFARDYLPSLGRDKNNREDAEDEGEATHICDAIRYACASRPLTLTAKKETRNEFQKPGTMAVKDILKTLSRQSHARTARRRTRR